MSTPEAEVKPEVQLLAGDLKDPTPKADRKRIPMNAPELKLFTPEIYGYRTYWFLEENIARAEAAGYEFVDSGETAPNQHGVGTDRAVDGNQDLGSRIRVYAGLSSENGHPVYYTLMKIKLEWFQEDQRAVVAANAKIVKSIFRDEKVIGDEKFSTEDRNQTYVKHAEQKPLLQRPIRKA